MPLTDLNIICRWFHFGALMLQAGIACTVTLLAFPDYRSRLTGLLQPWSAMSCWLALASTLSLLAVQTGLMGEGWKDIGSVDVWQAVLQTSFGQVWQIQCLLAMLAWLSLTMPYPRRQQVLLSLSVLQLAGLAFVGHAAMLEGWPGVMQRGNQILHLLAASFWAGGLLPVIVLMREARSVMWRTSAVATMMRFSRYGHLAVAVVITSGIASSLFLPGWPLVTLHTYGKLLLAKMALVAIMAALALYNRYYLVPRFGRCGDAAKKRFIAATWAELLLALLALLCVSLFATMNPA